MDLLFLELEPGSITPNYSKKLKISGDRQDIDDIIIQILEIFKIIDDYQYFSPHSSLPKESLPSLAQHAPAQLHYSAY